MGGRITWVLTSILASATLFAGIVAAGRANGTMSPQASPHDVIINEWSQGTGSLTEWVELLVVNGPIDMRDWELGDDTPGDLTFTNASSWSQVPAGTLVVIYNGSARDTLLPPDDLDSDDCAMVLPSDLATHFSGSFPNFSDSNTPDNPSLRDGTGVMVHDFSSEPGPSAHPGTAQAVQFAGNSLTTIGDAGEWTVVSAASAAPGIGNTTENKAWVDALCTSGSQEPDLVLSKTGPAHAIPGNHLVYEFAVNNVGGVTATTVVLTDTLPLGATYVGDDSPYPFTWLDNHTLVWYLGSLAAGAQSTFRLTATVDAGITGVLVNQAEVNTNASEPQLANNYAAFSTTVNTAATPHILIDAVLYDGYEPDHRDEAILLRNMTAGSIEISGWQVNDGEPSVLMFPPNTYVDPSATIWLAKEGTAFQRHFGFLPQFELVDSLPTAVPNLLGTWPQLADDGDQVILRDQDDHIIDCLIYEQGLTTDCGGEWLGPAVQPYQAGSQFAEEGQVLYRLRDQATGLPVADTNRAGDWAQSASDPVDGRRVRYPGWDLDEFFFTARLTETAVLTIAVSPDNAYHVLSDHIKRAKSSIQIESLTLESAAIGDALVAAANRGVSVTVLLEGAPPGGITDQEKYVCQRLESAGGQCWFMINDPAQNIADRYRFLHAKFIVIDGSITAIGSENLSPDSLPDDQKSDGTWGHRGIILVTNSAGVASHAQRLFALDLDPRAHKDLFRWQPAHHTYGAPPVGYQPITVTGGITYATRYTTPMWLSGTLAFEIQQSPENSLRGRDGLLGLVSQAGDDDTILVQQLSERPHWGSSASTPVQDPNPRLEALIDAARRGARVRILLDAFYDDSHSQLSNAATCQYVEDVAQREKLPIECALGDPSGMGIHSKLVLVRLNGRGYVSVGSLNGTELSHKGNRELTLQVQSDEAYAYLAEMFLLDWPYVYFFPVMLRDFVGRAGHVLISEVLYDPPGRDEAEFIELANPTADTIDLTHYSIGDAVKKSDFEDVRRFPEGTLIRPGQSLVIATTAEAFHDEYGFHPDFEILDTHALIPDMIDDKGWGDPAAFLRLGNAGDEILLRDPLDRPVDVVTYGAGNYPGVVPCDLVATAHASLERHPYWRDTNVCPTDFREWPFPNPGALP